MNPKLHLHLFGSPQIAYTDQPVTGFVSNKARALLIYLAVTGRAHSRDALAELLWADTPATMRNNLKKVLSNLRRIDGVSLVEEGYASVALAPDSYWIDTAKFMRLIEHDAADSWQRAADLYHGDFLAGFNTSLSYEFEEWATGEQTRLRGQMLDLLRRLSERYVQKQSLGAAISVLRRLTQFEPWEEAAHRRLIEVLALNSDMGAALAQFEICRATLQKELDVEPSPATLKLVADIREGKFEASVAPPIQKPNRAVQPSTQKLEKTTVDYALIGRAREQQVLCERWQMLDGSHLVCIGGEAGIGKTRLAEEVLMVAEGDDAAVARTRSHELQGQLAYGPVADWLRSAPLYPVVQQLDDVWRTEIARLLPELLVDGLTPPEPLTEGWQRKRFFDALVQAFGAVNDPLLLVLDDLQWTDTDTLEWIQYLVESDAQKILIVGTVRINDINADHPLHRVRQNLLRQGKLTEIMLSPLSEGATQELAALVVDERLEETVTDRLFRDTAGNPLFVIESMRAGSAGGSAADADFSFYPQAAGDANALPIPAKMYSVIQSRLAQLSPQAQELAQLSAAIGRAFDVTLLAQATGSDENAVLMVLDELWQRRILREVDAVHFDFAHDRIRDVAYAEIGPMRRRVLHREIATSLENIHSEDLSLPSGQLATHFEKAGVIEKSIDYLHQAAKESLPLSANEDALSYLKHGLKLLVDLPETHNTVQQRLALYTTLAIPTASIHGSASSAVQEIYTEIVRLSKWFGVEPSAQALRGLFSIYLVQGALEKSIQSAEKLLLQARKTSNISQIAEAHFAIGASNFWMGKFLESTNHFQSILELPAPRQQRQHTSDYGQLASVCCRVFQSIMLWIAGFPEQSENVGKECIADAHKIGHLPTHAYVQAMYCRVPQCLGLPTETLAHASRAIEITTQNSLTFWLAVGKVFRGWANAELGDPQSGIAEILEGIQGFRDTGASASTTWFLGLAARVYLEKFNDRATSLSYLEEAFDVAQRTKEELYLAELWRLRGELYLIDEDEEEAEVAYQRAIEVARSQEAKSWELRATINLCRLWQVQGKAAEARQTLAAIYGWFTEGFDTADLMAARELLAELDEQEEVSAT